MHPAGEKRGERLEERHRKKGRKKREGRQTFKPFSKKTALVFCFFTIRTIFVVSRDLPRRALGRDGGKGGRGGGTGGRGHH